MERYLHRMNLRAKRTGHELFLLIRARDAMKILSLLGGIVFGPDTEYDLVGINILGDIAPDRQ